MPCPVSTLTKRVHEAWLQGKVAGNRAFCIQPQVFLDRTEPTASLRLVSSGTYSGIYHYAFSLYCTRQGKQSWFGVVREMHAIWGITRILQITPWLYKLPYFTKHHQNHLFSRNSDSYLFKSMVAERSKRQTEFQSPETVLKSGLFGQLSFLTSLLCSLLHICPNPGYLVCSSHEFHKCLWHFSWPMPVK